MRHPGSVTQTNKKLEIIMTRTRVLSRFRRNAPACGQAPPIASAKVAARQTANCPKSRTTSQSGRTRQFRVLSGLLKRVDQLIHVIRIR
jgi:hypothetical protein